MKYTCASCSLTGKMSFSWRLVRINLTPQLMSNPTPPTHTYIQTHRETDSQTASLIYSVQNSYMRLRKRLRGGLWMHIPGETTADGSAVSKAAMFPMANP